MRNTLRTSVLGCRDPQCKVIYMLCWICGFCPEHCDCPNQEVPSEETLPEV